MPTIQPFLARDDADIETWLRLEKDSSDEAFPIFSTATEIAAKFTDPSRYVDVRGYVLHDDAGVPVGSGVLELPTTENTTMASADIQVVRSQRRRGYGRLLADQIRRDAVAALRTTWMIGVSWPAEQESSPGRLFAESLGLSCRNTVYHQVLQLPVLPAVLHGIAADAAARHASYQILGWQGRCPDEWVYQLAAAQGRMNEEVPLGDLELEPEVYDAARIRSDEDELGQRGRSMLTTVAVHGADLVGFTQLVFPEAGPDAFQWDTLVLPEHRGHRLGLAMKAANMLRFADLGRPSRTLHTWNAVSNAPMIAVNNAFGFRPADYRGEFQGPLRG